MFRSFGPWEILLILGVVLLLFGAARLPKMGHSLGRGLREFKNGITGLGSMDEGEKPRRRKGKQTEEESQGMPQH